MKKIFTARNIGFCFGVHRTVRMAEHLLAKHRGIYSMGYIVHNPLVMEGLKARGLNVVHDEKEVDDSFPFIVRSHGIGPDTLSSLKKKGVDIYDATCPFVKKIQALVKKLDKSKYCIIIIGNRKHPEVRALKEQGGKTFVMETAGASFCGNMGCLCLSAGRSEHLPDCGSPAAIAVIGQTTLSFSDYFGKARDIVAIAGAAKKTVIYNTICKVTEERQAESAVISRRADVVLVLGGRNSSNTTKLHQKCRNINPKTYHVEKTGELVKVDLDGVLSVGLVSGTSTPDSFILEVKKELKKKGYREVE